jgi:hypothetical protein
MPVPGVLGTAISGGTEMMLTSGASLTRAVNFTEHLVYLLLLLCIQLLAVSCQHPAVPFQPRMQLGRRPAAWGQSVTEQRTHKATDTHNTHNIHL